MHDHPGAMRWCRRRTRILCSLPLAAILAALVGAYFVGAEIPDLGPTSPVSDPIRPRIVAIGDSFTSGEGAPRYLLGTHGPTNRCHRARTAWPYLVAKALDYRLVSAACSGAVTANITGERTQYNEPPQLDAMTQDAAVVLVSVGGNDAQFGTLVKTCLTTDCIPQAQGWLDGLDGVGDALATTYDRVKAAAPASARLLVMTYPAPFASARCVPGMSDAEARFVVKDFLPRLNNVIRFTAVNHGFEVVEAQDAFVGARLCERPYRDAAMNVFTLARSRWFTGLVTGSFHPTPLGHQMLANRVLDHLATPRPDPLPPGAPPGPPGPPPDVPIGPPQGPYPFPTGTQCVGDHVTAEKVVHAVRDEDVLLMTGLAGSRYCSRNYKGTWVSGTVPHTGRARVQVAAAESARTRYVEVLMQGDDESWIRTLVFPPPLVEPPPATPYALMAGGASVLAASLGLFAAPFVLCRRARRRAARVIELAQ